MRELGSEHSIQRGKTAAACVSLSYRQPDATALCRGASRWRLQRKQVEILKMPRPCAVESHVCCVIGAATLPEAHICCFMVNEAGVEVSSKRETPRRKAVASQRVLFSPFCSRERESPRRKAVASVRIFTQPHNFLFRSERRRDNGSLDDENM
jgi:hypothetical protein